MKNKKFFKYSRKEIIDNPQLLLNKFEYYVEDDDVINTESLHYYFKVTKNYIFYYKIFLHSKYFIYSKIKISNQTLTDWFHKNEYMFF